MVNLLHNFWGYSSFFSPQTGKDNSFIHFMAAGRTVIPKGGSSKATVPRSKAKPKASPKDSPKPIASAEQAEQTPKRGAAAKADAGAKKKARK